MPCKPPLPEAFTSAEQIAVMVSRALPVSVDCGSYSPRGSPVLTLVALDEVWLDLRVPQERYGDLGDDVSIQVFPDALPGVKLSARMVIQGQMSAFMRMLLVLQLGMERLNNQLVYDLLLNNGLDFPVVAPGAALKPGGSVTVAPLHRGCTLPNAKVAIVAESDLTGRRRAHRTIRKQKRESASTFEDLKAGNYVVHHQHGVGKYEGMVKRAIGGVERDYLLISYKGGDKLYVPSDQIDTLRQYVELTKPRIVLL
jgi:transcription-repair coupling factor (superfamily II helicase)